MNLLFENASGYLCESNSGNAFNLASKFYLNSITLNHLIVYSGDTSIGFLRNAIAISDRYIAYVTLLTVSVFYVSSITVYLLGD